MRSGRAFATALALLCLASALLFGSAVAGRATRDRPPPGYTGGFGEPTCAECHNDAPVNEGTGSLLIEGFPDAYEQGVAYTITVTLAQAGLRAGGFELALRAAGVQAGSIGVIDSSRVGVTTHHDVQYAHHLYDGTKPVAVDTARWRVVWTAPQYAAEVMLHVSANAADDDFSPLGDLVYTTAASSHGRR